MTIGEHIADYRNDLFNILLCYMVKRTYLRASTIWTMMRRMDEQVTEKEMEHYVNEYKKWKENNYNQKI